MPTNHDLGQAIRRLRRSKRLTIQELACAADVHYGYLGRVERGGISPTWEKIVLLAHALDIELPTLMRRAEDEAEVARAMRETRARLREDRSDIQAHHQ